MEGKPPFHYCTWDMDLIDLLFMENQETQRNCAKEMSVGVLNRKIGFIGAGNMAEAIVGALTGSEMVEPLNIMVSDVSEERLAVFAEQYGVNTSTDNTRVFSESEVVVLAVKPQIMEKILREITEQEGYGPGKRKIVVSIAAGITTRKMEGFLYASLSGEERGRMPVVRVMPNTPALVLEGMSGMSANSHALPEDLEITRGILESMGKVIEFEEKHLDAVTALSGSGPAYVFYLVEAMVAAGERMGLGREDAVTMTLQTMGGALKLLEASGEAPEELRRRVTSPGGTTEAAINYMEENKVGKLIVEGIQAASARSKELS